MKPKCTATLTEDGRYTAHHCALYSGHIGAHRTDYIYNYNLTWPNVADPLYAAHPAGKASGKTTANWAHIVDAEMDRIKNETHVLLSKEDLITISYYLPFYTDDDDDPDNITKAKIDTALKKLL